MNIDDKKMKRKLPLHDFLIVKATAPSYMLSPCVRKELPVAGPVDYSFLAIVGGEIREGI